MGTQVGFSSCARAQVRYDHKSSALLPETEKGGHSPAMHSNITSGLNHKVTNGLRENFINEQ